MGYSLESHARQFRLSFDDCLFSAFTGFSGAPYVQRHIELSNEDGCTHVWGHRVIALLEAIPIFGGALALIERVSCMLYEITQTIFPSLEGRANPQKSLTSIDISMKKMWKNTRKAIEEHIKQNPEAPFITLEQLPSLDSLKELSHQAPLQIDISEAEEQGCRNTMEDAHFYAEREQGTLLGVLDGHSNALVSKHTASVFADKFFKALDENPNIRQVLQSVIDKIHEEVVQDVISGNAWNRGGTTVVVSFIDKRTNLIYTATLGDSESHVYREIEGVVYSIPLSCVRDWNSEKDAKRVGLPYPNPNNEGDKRRHPRTGINVSRSIGDVLHEGVIQKAKITVNRLLPKDVLVLACDGLTDYVSEQEVIQCIQSKPDHLARSLVDLAINTKQSQDNVTVLAATIS